ncbi:B-box zinc finger family protein [Striga asiatica]|uniref:B-box zinc finger family protein n=1 Tax=Striga asiatica TaxID=4170 RepID=A0A5A7P6Z5_STRAF|nr:B-box zinc finger family protein [Striga asiatica]
MKLRHCELCTAAATVYCPSDAAFLCRKCDAEVHGANFLVARHLRRPVCPSCRNPTGDEFSGAGLRSPRDTFQSCSPASEDGGSVSSSYSSDCISSTTSPAREYSGGRGAPAGGGSRGRGGGFRRVVRQDRGRRRRRGGASGLRGLEGRVP